MQTQTHHMTIPCTGWRNGVQRVTSVVVRPRFAAVVSMVLVDSITRNADAKPAPGGQERGVP
ncbi:MAG: hypothetical protein AB1689_16990 [Thermodesulfobacteriota bacterium]